MVAGRRGRRGSGGREGRGTGGASSGPIRVSGSRVAVGGPVRARASTGPGGLRRSRRARSPGTATPSIADSARFSSTVTSGRPFSARPRAPGPTVDPTPVNDLRPRLLVAGRRGRTLCGSDRVLAGRPHTKAFPPGDTWCEDGPLPRREGLGGTKTCEFHRQVCWAFNGSPPSRTSRGRGARPGARAGTGARRFGPVPSPGQTPGSGST